MSTKATPALLRILTMQPSTSPPKPRKERSLSRADLGDGWAGS